MCLVYKICAEKIIHPSDGIMSRMASQITSVVLVYSTVYSGANQGKHQGSASLAFLRRIHRWPVNPPHKGPVTRKIFPFDDVIMQNVVGLLLPMKSSELILQLATLDKSRLNTLYLGVDVNHGDTACLWWKLFLFKIIISFVTAISNFSVWNQYIACLNVIMKVIIGFALIYFW